MTILKKIIQDNIVSPANQSFAGLTTLAKVLLADEKNNLCTIQYIDKDGLLRNKDNVPVRIYGINNDWFPQQNDIVIIEEANDTVVITGKAISNYNYDVRLKHRLKNDIYSDCINSTCGGNIF